MNRFLEKYWSVGVAFALLSVVVFAFVKRADASSYNSVMAQTNALKNANFISVYNEDGVSHGAGSVVIYSSATVATYVGLSVSTTTTAGVTRVAGVVVGTLPAKNWGILQTSGVAAVKISVANSLGDPLVTSTTAEQAGIETISNSTTTVGADFGVFATALEATSSSTTVRCLIKLQ